MISILHYFSIFWNFFLLLIAYYWTLLPSIFNYFLWHMGWPFLELLPQMSSDFLFQNQSKINEANKEFSDWLGGKLPILSLPCTVSWQACHYNPKNNVIEILSLLLTLTLIKLASRCSLSGGGWLRPHPLFHGENTHLNPNPVSCLLEQSKPGSKHRHSGRVCW